MFVSSHFTADTEWSGLMTEKTRWVPPQDNRPEPLPEATHTHTGANL